MGPDLSATNMVGRRAFWFPGNRSQETIGRQSDALGKGTSKNQGTTVYRRLLIVMSYRAGTGDPMQLPIVATTTATFLLAQTVFAQNAPSDCNQAAGAEPEQNTTQLQQAKIERTLQGAGFTDIETLPTAFLVRAKNSEGKPVVMVLDPR